MRRPLAFSVFLAMVLPVVPLCVAQNISAPVDFQQLKGRTVFLRGMEAGDNLHFDAQGKLLGTGKPGAFAYSAIKIEKVDHKAAGLLIKGKRCALYFDTQSQSPSLNDIRFVVLKEPVTVAIDVGQSQSLTAVIQKIFALTAASELASISPAEETADLDTLGSTAPIPMHSKYVVDRGVEPHVYKAGIEASAPKLIHAVKPVYPKRVKLSPPGAICVVSLVVDSNGRPTHARITLSTGGPAWDWGAIVTVSQYRFEPATYKGKPVPVAIKIELNYRVM